ncbi:hypothetical protein ACGFR8_31070 [Streptomyces brevispora]|uniref:hypothetical protein n=1 Tax=Streptomyces brevispora TaxID=887462 RepID=UPI00371A5430
MKREAAAEKRRVARQAKETAEREAADAMRARVESLAVIEVTGRQELFDKGLNPYGERMRLVEVSVVLEDGEPAGWWEVTAYGSRLDEIDDRGGRYFRLFDARSEYQLYKYEPEQYRPDPSPRVGAAPCPPGGGKHCDHCGTTVAVGGWMTASLGQACGVDCYDAMSGARGAHANRHHH